MWKNNLCCWEKSKWDWVWKPAREGFLFIMSCVSSNWGAVISERSLLLCHLPGWYPNLPWGQGRQPTPPIETQVPLTCHEEQEAFSLFDSKKVGERARRTDFWHIGSSRVCFNQGHPEAMKWNLNVQNKSQISLSVTMKTLFFPLFFFQIHILGFFLISHWMDLERFSTSIRRFLLTCVLWSSAWSSIVASRANGNLLSDRTYWPRVKMLLNYSLSFKFTGTTSLFCCNTAFGLLEKIHVQMSS